MIILCDIGGTHSRVARGDGATLSLPVVFATSQSYSAGIETLCAHIDTLRNGDTPTAVIIGIAGTLAPDRKSLIRAPHIPEWCGKNIVNDIGAVLGVPVHLENDAALGALGEAVHGAGKGIGIVAYITVGTGIGGARVINGVLDPSVSGFEIGHQYLGMGTDAKELEELVSGSAIRAERDIPAEQITDENVWDAYAQTLSYGVFNTILHWSPHIVVLGGALFGTPGMKVENVEKHLKNIGGAFPLPKLAHGTLGDSCGLYGALVYASQV